MTWFLFMDESGHDHKNTPMEVRGGCAIHASKIWNFVQDFHEAEKDCFGVRLADYGKEIKGSKLLARKTYKWIRKSMNMDDNERHKAVKRFLSQNLQNIQIKRRDYYAYGYANKLMATKIFKLLEKHDAKLFASTIPRGVKKPKGFKISEYLRKDQIFMHQRFFDFLEEKQENGMFVMDQTEKQNDKRFVKALHNYYTKTYNGKYRSQWIIPSPLFVDSEMSPLVQAADLCIYCINWGFRLNSWNFQGDERKEIRRDFGKFCHNLQFKGQGYNENLGEIFDSYGIIFEKSPYF